MIWQFVCIGDNHVVSTAANRVQGAAEVGAVKCIDRVGDQYALQSGLLLFRFGQGFGDQCCCWKKPFIFGHQFSIQKYIVNNPPLRTFDHQQCLVKDVLFRLPLRFVAIPRQIP